jgi:curved DNA-binding protein CbpA
MKNYFKVMGLSESATDDDVNKAFRQLAQQYHPDRNPSPDAQTKFKEINEAYQTLRDPQKRQQHVYEIRQASAGPSPAASRAEADYRPPEYYRQNPAARPAAPTANPRRTPPWLGTILQSGQIFLWAIVGGGAGMALVIATRLILGYPSLFSFTQLLFGLVLGAAAGVTLPAENRLQMRLKARFKDGYHLMRAVLSCLAGVFFGGLLGQLAWFQFDLNPDATIYLGMIVGEIVFGLIAAEEAFWTKLRLPKAYFELFFVLVRMLGVALAMGVVALLIGSMLTEFEILTSTFDALYYGALLGVIFGSVAPSDLLAYSRYASAYASKWIVWVFIVLALLAGVAVGVGFGEQIRAAVGL